MESEADETTKLCITCGIAKVLTDFAFRRDRGGGKARKSNCKACHRAANAKLRVVESPARDALRIVRRKEHPDVLKERKERFLDRRLAEIRSLVTAAKSKPCADCGVGYPPYVMDFDHRPGTVKVFQISSAAVGGRSLATVQAEIEKCDLVCANCHRERTFSRVRDCQRVTPPKPPRVRPERKIVPPTPRLDAADVAAIRAALDGMPPGTTAEDLIRGHVVVNAPHRGRSHSLVGLENVYSKSLLKRVREAVPDMSSLALAKCLRMFGWRQALFKEGGADVAVWRGRRSREVSAA